MLMGQQDDDGAAGGQVSQPTPSIPGVSSLLSLQNRLHTYNRKFKN